MAIAEGTSTQSAEISQPSAATTSGVFLESFAAFDINSIDLNWYNQYGTDSGLLKNSNYTIDDQTYADAYYVQASDGYNYQELDFYGSGFTQDASGRFTAGTVNVVGEFDVYSDSTLWFAEGLSASAVDIYNAALTVSNADEIQLIKTALVGNDTIVMSEFDDVMGGYDGNDSIIGNGGDDNLTGGNGNDTIDGGSGNDILDGGSGTDTASYEDAASGVTVTLASSSAQDTQGAGTDTLTSFENLTGSAYDDNLTGNALANNLTGDAGNDFLKGGAGADTMAGGTGDDTYVVDDAHDVVAETVGEGIDTVRASINVTLAANVENLILTGAANLTGIGNELANSLTGNAGANKLIGNAGNDTLDGGVGNDRLIGGTGYDTYKVDSYNDSIVENAGEGIDSVIATASYKLSANVENLTLSGTADIYGYGNELDNQLTGNSGTNKLFGLAGSDAIDGKAGADRMTGGTGDDTYYVDNYSDRVIENAGEGTDSVFTSTNYKLSANVEDLTITGASNLWAYGNDIDNSLTGNSGANKLYGMSGDDAINGGAGNDWIEGGAGQDELSGGAGADSFVFRDGDFGLATIGTADRILDFSQADHDQIRLNFVDANTTLTGDQAFTFQTTAAFDGHAGELRFEQINGNTYVEGDTNGDGTADFMIRIDGLQTLTSHDFVL